MVRLGPRCERRERSDLRGGRFLGEPAEGWTWVRPAEQEFWAWRVPADAKASGTAKVFCCCDSGELHRLVVLAVSPSSRRQIPHPASRREPALKSFCDSRSPGTDLRK